MEYNSSHHSNVDTVDSTDSTTFTADPNMPTAFSSGNWGQRCDLATIKRTHVPNFGPDTWRPLPHDTFVGMIEQAFDRHGFTISEALHYRSKSVNNDKIKDQGEYGRFSTSYGISHPLLPVVDGIDWESSWFNSYDMTKAAGGDLERRTLICTNGMTVGECMATFRRKHTSGIDVNRDGLFEHIYDLVNSTVGSLVTVAQGEAKRLELFSQTACKDTDARWIILEAAKQNVIGAAATMDVLKHFETPEHPEFKDGSVMCLDNAFSSNARGKNLMTQRDRMSRLGVIIDKRFGFGNKSHTEELATNF